MTNTELYINNILCDTSADFTVRLNRQLLNPGELNTKDAQFSYSISLPSTATNNKAFQYANVEETKGKFNRVYKAQLIINSVRVFTGNFRLSEITVKGYKGNLYIPALRSIKDIFGELKLNQSPELRIDFTDFATSVNAYNLAAANAPQYAIFPYVLYGVLPKVPLNKNANSYSARDLWDDTVRMGMQDLAPSINPLLMLRHIFESQGYALQGNAFDDARLLGLYMSYKNRPEYVQPWNYGQQAKIQLNGSWSSRFNARTGFSDSLERGVNQGSDSTGNVYSCDFLDAVNTNLNVIEDTGGNVQHKLIKDADGVDWLNGQIRIPQSGFYKVRFGASLQVNRTEDWRTTDPATGVQHISGYSLHADNDIRQNLYEIRLCRDRGAAEFGLSGPRMNNQFYYNNQPQNETFNADFIPKYFPPVSADGGINFVDLAQDKFHLLGFAVGQNADYATAESTQYRNPLDTSENLCNLLIAKPATSWMSSENDNDPTRLAIQSPGYMKYGHIGDFDNEDDNPDMDIDYSAGPFITGQILDGQGNPMPPSPGNLDARISDYAVNRFGGYLDYVPGWDTSDYIDLSRWTGLQFSAVVTENPDASVMSFYDAAFQFIGSSIDGPGIGNTDTYTNEPILPPSSLAVYARISGDSGFTISGTDVATGNKILHRFPIQRWYTYKLTTDPSDGYEGFAYIHDGATVGPLSVTPFVNGVAEIVTSFSPILTPLDLKLTIYLKTPNFDVDGTLTISREITPGNENVVSWEPTNKYKITLDNAPANFLRRGEYLGAGGFDPLWYAEGKTACVVWLNAGELITIASVCCEGRFRGRSMHSTWGWVNHEVHFDLSIQPFRVDPEWLRVSLSGNGTAPMDWDDPVNFDVDSINLVGFLNADIKTDDFIDNFCKAYNLRLSQLDARTFSLDVKQTKTNVSNQYVNLDGVASVNDRSNSPLGLPSLYKLGFTVDVDEEGFAMTGDDGGGSFTTGVTEEKIVEQKSFFSYNWYKPITKDEPGGDVTLPLPIISKADVWNPVMSYPDAMKKKFTDQAYRFWYYGGLLNDLGATFTYNNAPLNIARVSEQLPGSSVLSYKNQPFTILDNFFTILINGASHYTELEGYITPLQYQALNGSILAMFNGDLYYIAELSGYDAGGRNKTKIKLIRKI